MTMSTRKGSLQIGAQFILDQKGRPRYEQDEHGLRHYRIRLFVDGATPKVKAVTYKLHDSYYDPLREVFRDDKNPDDRFSEVITSFGDYSVIVSPSGDPSLPGRAVARLSRALELGTAPGVGDTDAIDKAMRYIREG
jgi:hypothetical protein